MNNETANIKRSAITRAEIPAASRTALRAAAFGSLSGKTLICFRHSGDQMSHQMINHIASLYEATHEDSNGRRPPLMLRFTQVETAGSRSLHGLLRPVFQLL